MKSVISNSAVIGNAPTARASQMVMCSNSSCVIVSVFRHRFNGGRIRLPGVKDVCQARSPRIGSSNHIRFWFIKNTLSKRGGVSDAGSSRENGLGLLLKNRAG